MIKASARYFFFILLLSIIRPAAQGQSFNHWGRSFNEESSLLSGAVVGGGAGPSAVYYNPSAISEISESKLSFNASLFSYNFYHVENALGDGINLDRSILQIEPRFLSYMIKPKNHPNWDFEIAILNNVNYKLDATQSVDWPYDVLTNIPGDERYYALVQYYNRFRDDWIGAGWSWKINPRLFIGTSMFVTIKSLEYSYSIDIEAYPLDTVAAVVFYNDFHTAHYSESNYLKYNDYRLLWKLGMLYKARQLSIGFCISSPSVGGIYSDGKRISHKQKQSNISMPESGEPVPDYFIADYQEKKNVSVNHKTPFSMAIGLSWQSADRTQAFYSTVEYFGGLEAYRLASAETHGNIASGLIPGGIIPGDWLTFVGGARPVLNAAVGYSWIIAEDLRLLTGFRTDFNYLKDFEFDPLAANRALKSMYADRYHVTGGLSWSILGQGLITGIQYTIARERNQQQLINLSDPVEYNTTEMAPLQGTRQHNLNFLLNALSLYIGATFNFGGDE